MTLPILWPEHRIWPEEDTLVHLLQTGTIRTASGGCAALPGGFFARTTTRSHGSSGEYRVLTLPQSAVNLIAMSRAYWNWDKTFEGQLSSRAANTDWFVRIERVPPDVADAVRATLALDGWNPDTDEPMVVEDGWMT